MSGGWRALLAAGFLALAAPGTAQEPVTFDPASSATLDRAATDHRAGRHDEARAALLQLLNKGERRFDGLDDQLIGVLLLLLLAEVEAARGDEAASAHALLRAARAGRAAMAAASAADGLGFADPAAAELGLRALVSLARYLLETGDLDGAALLGAEASALGHEEAGRGLPGRREATLIHAVALARLGQPVDAIARAAPVTRDRAGHENSETADLLRLLKEALTAESAGDAATLAAWMEAAPAREAALVARDLALVEALAPMLEALRQGDLEAADRAARATLEAAAPDDPTAAAGTIALLTAALRADQPDLARFWAERLATLPAGYLASLDQDLLAPLSALVAELSSRGEHGPAAGVADLVAELAPLRDGPEAVSVQVALVRMGAAARDAGRPAEAQAALDQAVALTGVETPPSIDRARVGLEGLIDRALLHQDQGRLAEAEADYRAAIALLESSPAGEEAAGWLFALGAYRDFLTLDGRYEDAEAMAAETVTRIDALAPVSRGAALARFELARVIFGAGDAAGALKEAERAADLAREALPPGDPSRGRVIGLLADILDDLGRSEEAQRLREESGRPASIAEGTDALAHAQAAQRAHARGDLAGALAILDQTGAELDPEDPMLAQIRVGQAVVLGDLGDREGALERLREATWALTQPDRRHEFGARDHLPLHVALALDLSDEAEGIEAANLFTEAFQVAQRVNDLAAGSALGRGAARTLGDTPEAVAAARSYEDAVRALEAARAEHLARLARGEDTRSARQALALARDDLARARTEVDVAFPTYLALADPRPLDLVRTMQLLGPDEALVLFATTDQPASSESGSRVFALTAEGFMASRIAPRAELLALARALRCQAALTDPGCGTVAADTRGVFSIEPETAEAGPDFDLALASQAFEATLAPVAAALEGKTSLIVVPDRALVAMPFSLLLTRPPQENEGLREAPWLIRERAVTILPSVGSLAALRAPSARPSAADRPFLGIGDPLVGVQANGPLDYDCTDPEPMLMASRAPDAAVLRIGGLVDLAALAALPALPDTRCELLHHATLLGTPDSVLLHEDATETRLRELSETGELARYRIVSFATHGLIAGELGASDAGLVLTPPAVASARDDGLLTTGEIAELRLDAEFVILSACNTAAGSAEAEEGLSGLASAFFLAGTRSLLVSHWPVYSDAASSLTTGIADAMATDAALGQAEALRRAMLSILDDPYADMRQQHPAYWGAFMIVG